MSSVPSAGSPHCGRASRGRNHDQKKEKCLQQWSIDSGYIPSLRLTVGKVRRDVQLVNKSCLDFLGGRCYVQPETHSLLSRESSHLRLSPRSRLSCNRPLLLGCWCCYEQSRGSALVG